MTLAAGHHYPRRVINMTDTKLGGYWSWRCAWD